MLIRPHNLLTHINWSVLRFLQNFVHPSRQADVEVQGSPTLAQPVLRRRAHQQQQQQQLQQGPSAATDSVNTGDSASLASGAAPLGVPKRPRTGAATRLSAGAQSAGWLQGIIGNAGGARP